MGMLAMAMGAFALRLIWCGLTALDELRCLDISDISSRAFGKSPEMLGPK